MSRYTSIVFILILVGFAFVHGEEQSENGDKRIIGYRKEREKRKIKGVEVKGRNYSHKKKKIEKIIPQPIPPVVIEEPSQHSNVKIESPGYTGELKDGKRHGKGKLVLRNGDVYIGSWEDNKKTGQGVYLYSNGIKYNGQWKDDIMEGSGSFIFPRTGVYYGDIKNGQMTGYGVFKYSDGSIYEGYWKGGKWHGKGKYSLPDGRSLAAIFAEHQVVKIISKEETGGNS